MVEKNKMCKIVYFDEDSVTDYVQMVYGGELEKTKELLKQTANHSGADVMVNAKIGFGDVVKALIGSGVSAEANTNLNATYDTNNMAKNIVKNTILTDFIDIINESDKESNQDKTPIHKFTGYNISAPKDSLSYVALISPYLSMFKGGTSIPAGDYNIALEKLDSTIKQAKGYYEFLGIKDNNKVIFRFNIKSFKNNYKAPDLMKMDIAIFAIKVGTSSIDDLNFNNEFDIEDSFVRKDNPDYISEPFCAKEEMNSADLEVYDVLLAGVEYNG